MSAPLTETGPQQLAITDQDRPGLPRTKGKNRLTSLVAGRKVGKGRK